MQHPGLYFPYVHIRDEVWLKAAALYWPSLRRLVPAGYRKHDSPTAQAFADAHILMDEDPGELLDSSTWDLLQVLRQNTDRLMHKYSVEQAFADWDGQQRSDGSAPGDEVPALGWIHVTKFPRGVVDYLSNVGLLYRGRAGESVWRDPGHPEEWVGLHPALAGAYMTALAGRLSKSAMFQPLTDQTNLRVATATSDVGAAMRLLLGRDAATGAGQDMAAGVETYVMLALQHVRPATLEDVPAEKIVECRRDLTEELAAFRVYVESQQSELAEIATVPAGRRRLEAFAQHVEQTVELPLRKLERGLLLHKLESRPGR